MGITSPPMHTHVGALHLVTAFIGVALVGTLWRLSAFHLTASSNPSLAKAGKAMLVQY